MSRAHASIVTGLLVSGSAAAAVVGACLDTLGSPVLSPRGFRRGGGGEGDLVYYFSRGHVILLEHYT